MRFFRLFCPREEHDGTTRHSRTPLLDEEYTVVARSRCPLMHLTWQKNWPGVVQRCESHPDEACRITSVSGRTALHLACFNSGCPIYVAEALIQANPHALLVQDTVYGWTPLHYVCGFIGGTNPLIPLFCESVLTAERALGSNILRLVNDSPLHLACKRNAPLYTLEALLATRREGNTWIAPITGGEPYWQRAVALNADWSPLRSLSTSFSNGLSDIDDETLLKMKRHTIESFHIPRSLVGGVLEPSEEASAGAAPGDDEGHNSAYSDWQKCLLLLKEGAIDLYWESPVHLLSALAVPIPVLLACSMDLFPALILQRDKHGLLPLHHLILHLSWETTVMLQMILQREPSSACIDFPNGSFPITMALQERMKWDEGLGDLMRAAPDILRTRDKSSHLYPVLMAASLDAELDTIFRMMRHCPEFIKHCLE